MNKKLNLKLNTKIDKLANDVENIDITGSDINNKNLFDKINNNIPNTNNNNPTEKFKEKIYKINDSK